MSSERYHHWLKIGEGAYGIVYLAEDLLENRQVAIKKVLLPALSEKQGTAFLQRMCHPACPCILDQFEENGYCFFVMTYFEGGNLGNRTLSRKKARQLILEMLDVMTEMQRLRITYNDFKPTNILYDGHHFYLIDFGSVIPCQSQQARLGSKAFASPEYLSGDQIDWRSDLYSLAKTVQYLVIRPDPVLYLWLKKALKENRESRFKNLSTARRILTFHCYFYLCLCLIAALIGSCCQPIQNICYQWALEKENWQLCLQIDPTREEVFEHYLFSHDALSCQTWIVLWQWQIAKVRNEDFLWQCIYQLAYLPDDFSWQLQSEIIAHLEGQKADMYRKLLDSDDDFGFFEQWACQKADRIYLYQFCLCQKQSVFPLIAKNFEQWVEEDIQLTIEEKWTFLTDGAILSLDETLLDDIYHKIPDHLLYLKAQIACTLFEIGNYQAGWLHHASDLLEECQADTKCQSLYDDVRKEIEQWGSKA